MRSKFYALSTASFSALCLLAVGLAAQRVSANTLPGKTTPENTKKAGKQAVVKSIVKQTPVKSPTVAANIQTSSTEPKSVPPAASGASGIASGQETAPPIGSRATASGRDAAYLLGADDVIEVNVRNFSELSRVLIIQPDGRINFPEVGELDAAGKTPKELAGEIQKELEVTRNNAGVTVSVKEIHSRRFKIVGSAVRAAGTYDLKRNWHLLEAVAVAGGLSSAKLDRVEGRIVRDAKTIPINMTEAMKSPDSAANMPLEADDLIILEELDAIRNQASVIGQVQRPGAFDYDPETNPVGLLAQAGGPLPNAALRKAYLQRGSQQIPMDLYNVVTESKQDDAITKFRLKPGDILYIPENKQKFTVGGAVGRPAEFVFPEDKKMTVLQALYLAGGPIQGGSDQGKAVLIRQVDDKPTAIPVNFNKIQDKKKPDLAANVIMQPDDVLYVPGRGKPGPGLQDIMAPFSILSFMGLRLFR